MDYTELVESLRFMSTQGKRYGMAVVIMEQAADSIEYLISALNHADEQIESLVEANEKRRWIAVEERLPDMHKEVLVCNEDYGLSGLGFATVAVWDGTDWIETWERKTALHYITHWQPLPEPPKEETE